MSMVAQDAERWLVSTRAHGEVLTTGVSGPGLEIRVLGLPPGYAAPEIESWLQGLVRAAREGSGEPLAGEPVPPMVRVALGGLLFSHAELWSRSGPATPCSVVLADAGDRIAFGWVGEAEVEIQVDGKRVESEWVSVRDPLGREARAWIGAAWRDARVELASFVGEGGAAVQLEAHWTSRRPEALAIAPPMAAAPEAPMRPAGDALPAVELSGESRAAPPPSSGVARWLGQHLEWSPEGAEPGRAASAEASPAPVGAGPRPIAPPTPAAVPPEPPAERPARPAIPAGALEPVHLPPEVPDQIPPTPEPEAATAGAPAPERSEAASPRRARPRQPAWPVVVPPERPAGWKKPLLWGLVVAGLFGIGWMLGSFQGAEGPAQAKRPSPLVTFLRRIGLAASRFQVAVRSYPEGAWVAVDGKELGVRAPVTLELAPGEHRVDLSFPDLGSSSFTVRGAKHERVALEAPLWGSIEVAASDPAAVVTVGLDGQSLGFAPIRIDSVAPGAHELRFTGPGMASWGTTVEVRVGETREVLAYPLTSPATGLLQVRAALNSEGESRPLTGARVWVDGQPRGNTPLTLELPRGPHSVRVATQREEAPVQLIDLPGGNQRFATFEFGLDVEFPRLVLRVPPVFTFDEPALVSATLSEVAAAETREMWLHVRTPENRWRRYPMTLMDAQGSVVGAAPFPVALLGPGGRTQFYVSALTGQGDEHFTEIQTARAAPPRR